MSAISIFAVVLFRIDQRLLITTTVPISISGMSSSSSLPCICCLWLYDNPQPERRGEAFPAEWSRSFRCFCVSKRDEIAPRFCLLSVASWNGSHACCIAARRQESMMPVSKHFYPKCQRKDPKCHNVWRHLIQPPYHHGRLWWINSSNESISWLIYGSVPIWTSHAGNQLGTDGICPAVVDCDQMPQEVYYEDDGSPSDNNDTDDERMPLLKDESE